MQSKRHVKYNLLAIVVVLLSPAFLGACVTTQKVATENTPQHTTDSVSEFVPTHPPIVVPHSWRETIDGND